MPKKSAPDFLSIIELLGSQVDKYMVIKALRSLCAWFGGQLIYIPLTDIDSKGKNEIVGILQDSAGDRDGDLIYTAMQAQFGGSQVYIPMERSAFRNVIAQEIYKRYNGTQDSMREICREYGVSFTQVYRLYESGKQNNDQAELCFDEKE